MAKIIKIPNIVNRMEAVRRAASNMALSKDVAVRALVDVTMERFNTWNPNKEWYEKDLAKQLKECSVFDAPITT